MEEAIARDTFIYYICIQQGQDATEAVAGYQELGGHNLVAQLQCLAQQSAVVVHCEQALVGRVA